MLSLREMGTEVAQKECSHFTWQMGQNNGPQSCPCPNLQRWALCCLVWQTRHYRHDEVKDPEIGEIILGYLGGYNVITRIFPRGEGSRRVRGVVRSECRTERQRDEDSTGLALTEGVP